MVLDPAQKSPQSPRKDIRSSVELRSLGQVAAGEDLESFQFEVTAGKKLLAGNRLSSASDLRIRTDQPHNSEPSSPQSSVEVTQANSITPRILVAKKSFLQPRRNRSPSWVISLMVHLLAILGLAYFTFTTFEPRIDFTLSLESEAFAEDELEFQEIVIDPLEEVEMEENSLAGEIQEASQVAASELSNETALADLASISGTQEKGLGDLANLFGEQGSGLSDMLPAKEKLTATFFETKIEGRRIVFVVDNSGGMQDGQLETLIIELMRSVESLKPDQEFYVIFYSDMLYPLFYPHPVQRFVPANDRFKKQLRRWLDTVEFCTGNSVDQAIQAAASIRPDAVYLLTDGDVKTTPSGRKLAVLLDSRGRRFPIHTFGIGMKESHKAAENLRLVAEANKGTFRTVEVSAEAKERAKQQKRPYHNKEPGKVWGLNVGSGWGKKR